MEPRLYFNFTKGSRMHNFVAGTDNSRAYPLLSAVLRAWISVGATSSGSFLVKGRYTLPEHTGREHGCHIGHPSCK